MAAASKMPPQFGERCSSFVMGRNSRAIKSDAALLQMNTESAIKGKSDGITESEHRESPWRTPSESSFPSNNKITTRETAQIAVKIFFLFKTIRLS